MISDAVQQYFDDCLIVRRSRAGTPETAFYPALNKLLDTVGASLKPRVHCVMSLRNQGAGLPDGGLFTRDQLPKDDLPDAGNLPSRGAIECKPPSDDALAVARSPQVSKYWQRYCQVLVTSYREFVLIGRDEAGKPVCHEYLRLADIEAAFWKLAAESKKAVATHGERLIDFLKRCLRRPAPLTDPKDVAWFLASYARDARERVEKSAAHEKMATVRKALEDALGLKVEDQKGEHFFHP